MKNLLLLLSLSFLLTGCGKSNEDSDVYYYWVEGEKIPLTVMRTKHYILFPSKDVSAVIGTLTSKGVNIDPSMVFEYETKSLAISGDIPAVLADCSFAIVNSEKDVFLEKLPELTYAAPYFRTSDGSELGITNILSVRLGNDEDIVKLRALAMRYNLVMLGKSIWGPPWYYLACTKESRGNALVMANLMYESGAFEYATPEFLVYSGPAIVP